MCNDSNSLIHSRYFYSASSSPLLLSALRTTALILHRSEHAEMLQATVSEGLAHKVTTWLLEWDLNLWPSGHKAPNLPLSHHASQQQQHDRNIANMLAVPSD